jgi:hypothetical protein
MALKGNLLSLASPNLGQRVSSTMECKTIPGPVIAVVGEVLGLHYYDHNRLNTLYHGAWGVW